jgi:hypothetical protein
VSSVDLSNTIIFCTLIVSVAVVMIVGRLKGSSSEDRSDDEGGQ